MGAVLLAGGTKGKRFALPNANIMIHQVLGGAEGQASDVEIRVKFMLKLKERLNTILSKHTGQPYEAVERAFVEELERLAAEGPTAAELERAKALTESEELLARSDPEELADAVGMYATLLNDPGRINRDLDLALAVTADQVQTAAKLFAKENRIVLWYVPEEKA
jgi:predicted Zn-dependent peptidase